MHIALHGEPTQVSVRILLYGITQVNSSHLNLSQASWYSIYLPWKDGRLSRLHTKMVYRPADGHPSKY